MTGNNFPFVSSNRDLEGIKEEILHEETYTKDRLKDAGFAEFKDKLHNT